MLWFSVSLIHPNGYDIKPCRKGLILVAALLIRLGVDALGVENYYRNLRAESKKMLYFVF